MIFVMESRTKNVRDSVLKRAFLVDFLEHKSILSLPLTRPLKHDVFEKMMMM